MSGITGTTIRGFVEGVWNELTSYSQLITEGVATYYGLDDEALPPRPMELTATILTPPPRFDASHVFAAEDGSGYVSVQTVDSVEFGPTRVIIDCRRWSDFLASLDENIASLPGELEEEFTLLSERTRTLFESELPSACSINAHVLVNQYIEECTLLSDESADQVRKWIAKALERILDRPKCQFRFVDEAKAAKVTWEEVSQLPILDRFLREVIRVDSDVYLDTTEDEENEELVAFARLLAFRDPAQWHFPSAFNPLRYRTEGQDVSLESMMPINLFESEEVIMAVKSFLLHFLLLYKVSPSAMARGGIRITLRPPL